MLRCSLQVIENAVEEYKSAEELRFGNSPKREKSKDLKNTRKKINSLFFVVWFQKRSMEDLPFSVNMLANEQTCSSDRVLTSLNHGRISYI